MFHKIATASTALLAIVSAGVPLPQRVFYPLRQVANFDNAVGVPLIAASPIGVYQELYWQGISLAKTGNVQSTALVTPKTAPNTAAFSALDLATVQQGQPSILSNYPSSTIEYFDLHEFWYGCTVAAQISVAAVPVSCTITVKGYSDSAGKTLASSQEFKFTAPGLLTGGPLALKVNAPMQRAFMNGKFTGLKRVDFFVDSNLVKAALIDSVLYTSYSNQKRFP